MGHNLIAWGTEDGRFFKRWNVEVLDEFIIFRLGGSPRSISIPSKEYGRITVDFKEPFRERCPGNLIGKPKVKLSNIVFGFEGDGTDILLKAIEVFTSPIKSSLNFQTSGRNIIIRMCPIGKDEVLSGSLKNLDDLVRSIENDFKVFGQLSTWNLTISGYDEDPRSLIQIPEVVAWYRKAHKAYPFLPFFLSDYALKSYLLAQLEVTVVATNVPKKLTQAEKAEIDRLTETQEKLKPGSGKNFRHQLEHEAQYGIDPKKVQALLFGIALEGPIFLAKIGVPADISDPFLNKAIDRLINSIKS